MNVTDYTRLFVASFIVEYQEMLTEKDPEMLMIEQRAKTVEAIKNLGTKLAKEMFAIEEA